MFVQMKENKINPEMADYNKHLALAAIQHCLPTTMNRGQLKLHVHNFHGKTAVSVIATKNDFCINFLQNLPPKLKTY